MKMIDTNIKSLNGTSTNTPSNGNLINFVELGAYIMILIIVIICNNN
jgi:hypothetical protein